MDERQSRSGRDSSRAPRDPARRYGPSSRDLAGPERTAGSGRLPPIPPPPRPPGQPPPWRPAPPPSAAPGVTGTAAPRARRSTAGTGPGGRATTGRRPERRRGGWAVAARRLLLGGRLTLALVSVLVLTVTGVGWRLYHGTADNLTTSDVIGTGGPPQADGATDILLVGVDSRTDAQGQPLPPEVLRELHASAEDGVLNTDTIIVVRVPNDGSPAYAISIPRDSYVQIPNYRKDKINAAYPATKALTAADLVQSGTTDPAIVDSLSSAAGRRSLISTVQDLTGLYIDHYAEINLLGFYNLTNAIGGVEVCLLSPVADSFSGADFPAGAQTVSGSSALAFVRQRHGLLHGDLDRIRRQQVFLAAVAHKVLSAGTLTSPSRLGALLAATTQSVVLDSGWDVLGFARQMQGLVGGDIRFVTIPTDGLENNSRGSVLVVDPQQVQQFVRDLVSNPVGLVTGGIATASPVAADPTPIGNPTIAVRNGAGVIGLAGVTAAQSPTQLPSTPITAGGVPCVN